MLHIHANNLPIPRIVPLAQLRPSRIRGIEILNSPSERHILVHQLIGHLAIWIKVNPDEEISTALQTSQ